MNIHSIRVGEASWRLAAHLGEEKLRFQTLAVMRKFSIVEKISGDNF